MPSSVGCPVPSADMENGAVGSSLESPAAEVDAGASPGRSPVIKTKGRGLRRWRRIPREQHKEGGPAVSDGSGAADEDSAQLHKRRIPLPADAPRGKHEVALEGESPTASVESRFVPLASPPAKLDLSLGVLIASSGFSVGAGGADSDNSEDRGSSKSSTAASAPRRHDLSPFAARDRAADRARSSLHGKNPRAARARADKARAFAAAEAENSRSSVESDLRSSQAVSSWQSGAGVATNGIHNILPIDCDQSGELRSTAGRYCKENGSVIGRLAKGSVDSDAYADAAASSMGKNGGNGSRIQSSADPYAESILLLQRTQEALENEIQKFAMISKDPRDDFDGCDNDWSGSVHLEEPLEETSQTVKDLESNPEEASYLGQLFLEKTEAEIQSIILTRAAQTWAPLAEDQIALYNAQKSLSGDYKQLELKLQHTNNRAVMLEEMAEKLKAECKDLSGSSEVLRLQSRASRVSLFCFIQFILLFTAIGTFLAQLMPSPTEDVPT